MIEPYLAHFLKTPSSGVTSNTTRQEARTALQEKIGTRVFSGRRDPGRDGDYQLTLQRISSRRYNDLDGEDGMVDPQIQIDVWGKGDNAAWEVPQIAELVRQSIAGYRGLMQMANEDTVFVHSIAVIRDAMKIPTTPTDVQVKTGWNFHWSLDVEIGHSQTEV